MWERCQLGMGAVALVLGLGAVELVVTAAQDFTGGEAVVGGRGRAEAFAQERKDVGRPSGGMVATGAAGQPEVLLLVGTSGEVIGVEFVEAAAGEVELAGGGPGFDLLRTELGEDVTDERGRKAMSELVFFMDGERNAKRTRRESEWLDLTLWH